MANNSLKNKFRNLYKEFKDNLSSETCEILESLYTLDAKFLYMIKHMLSDKLIAEGKKITAECEETFSLEELIDTDYDDINNNYCMALILSQQDIDKNLKSNGLEIADFNDAEFPLKRYIRFNILDKYKSAINKISNELEITGEVIDFFLKVKDY